MRKPLVYNVVCNVTEIIICYGVSVFYKLVSLKFYSSKTFYLSQIKNPFSKRPKYCRVLNSVLAIVTFRFQAEYVQIWNCYESQAHLQLKYFIYFCPNKMKSSRQYFTVIFFLTLDFD